MRRILNISVFVGDGGGGSMCGCGGRCGCGGGCGTGFFLIKKVDAIAKTFKV